jgi:hypothetical protein
MTTPTQPHALRSAATTRRPIGAGTGTSSRAILIGCRISSTSTARRSSRIVPLPIGFKLVAAGQAFGPSSSPSASSVVSGSGGCAPESADWPITSELPGTLFAPPQAGRPTESQLDVAGQPLTFEVLSLRSGDADQSSLSDSWKEPELCAAVRASGLCASRRLGPASTSVLRLAGPDGPRSGSSRRSLPSGGQSWRSWRGRDRCSRSPQRACFSSSRSASSAAASRRASTPSFERSDPRRRPSGRRGRRIRSDRRSGTGTRLAANGTRATTPVPARARRARTTAHQTAPMCRPARRRPRPPRRPARAEARLRSSALRGEGRVIAPERKEK